VSVARALEQALGHVMLLPGDTDLLLGSTAPLPAGWRTPAERLDARRIDTRRVSAAYIRYLYENDRRAESHRLLEDAGTTAIRTSPIVNRDARPVAHALTLLIELSRQVPSMTMMQPPSCAAARSRAALGGGALLLAGVALVLRRRWGMRRLALAGAAGLVGMMLEGVWILAYQIRSGVLYQDIGLLLTAFMLGLALGAALMERLGGRRPVAPGRVDRIDDMPCVAGRWGVLSVVGLLVLSAVTAMQLAVGRTPGLAGAVLGLGLAGTLVAAVFAYASLSHLPRRQAARTGLYAADLVGGALAAVAGGLLVVPFCGLDAAAWMMAALAAAAILLV
jgi:hypothetical protein